MTKAKSVQARAAKRNARAKTKKQSNAKARTTARTLHEKNFRRALGANGKMEFDQVLRNAVRDVNTGNTHGESEIKSMDDLLISLNKNASEVFKLYSYVTFVEAMNAKKLIDHPIIMDLEGTSLGLMDLDRRVGIVGKLIANKEEEAVFTEALELGTILQNYSEELYAEVVRSEPHALIIEETLQRLSKEVEGDMTEEMRRFQVLQSIAYKYLADVKERHTPAPTPAEAEAPVAETEAQ